MRFKPLVKLELKNNTLTVEYGDDVNSLLKDCIDISIYENKDVIDEIKKIRNNININADDIAKELGAARSMNMVMLGAASAFMDIKVDELRTAIRDIFERKGDKVVDSNLKAFDAGLDFSNKNRA